MPRIGQNRSDKRRAAVARLRRERRPVGPPPMGFKHRGPKGNRRIVPDDEAREVALQIVFARDELKLSWDKVSDHVDQYLAKKHGRPPTPRWDRRPWSKGQCHRWYYRQKALQASEGHADDRVYRQCKTCGRSKPITEFSLHGGYRRRECRPCRAIRTFRQREAERREKVVDGFHQLAQLASKESPESPRVKEVLRRLGELCGNAQTMARFWREALDSDVHHRPGGLALFRKFMTVIGLMMACEEHKRRQAAQVQAMLDQELDRAIDDHIDRRIARWLADGESITD